MLQHRKGTSLLFRGFGFNVRRYTHILSLASSVEYIELFMLMSLAYTT